MQKKVVHFGLIGCGRIGKVHASLMQKRGKLVAVCDIERQKADLFADEYDAKPYIDFKSMLVSHPEIELISVCTPNGLHADHSITALERGCHVLCEKPMALNPADCLEMLKSAERNDRLLFVVKQNRYNPPVLAVKKLLNENRLGKIYSLQLNCFWNRNREYYQNSWKGTSDLDGGTLFTQFSHFIDLLYWMIGDVAEVTGMTGNFAHGGQIEFEDTGVAILRFEQGAIGTINYTVNSFASNMEGSLAIFGEKGTVKIGGQYLNELEYQRIDGYTIPDLPKGNPPNNYGEYRGSMSNHDKVFDNVVDVLRGHGKMMTSPLDGLKTVEIINRFYHSSKRVV